MILSWLLKSMEPEINQTNMYLNTTKQLWDAMNETYSNLANSLQVYELKTKIGNTTKGNLFVTSYYNMLKSLWQELDLFYDLDGHVLKTMLNIKGPWRMTVLIVSV